VSWLKTIFPYWKAQILFDLSVSVNKLARYDKLRNINEISISFKLSRVQIRQSLAHEDFDQSQDEWDLNQALIERELIYMTELQEHLLEEIEFWEKFIEGWNTDSKGPLPEKARDSLIYAQYKMDRYLTATDASVQTGRQHNVMKKT
jgi:hypothetical protein